MELKINFVAILITVVVNFVIGFIWYTPLFGKAWAKEMGYDTNMEASKGEMFKGMAFMVIGNFFFAYVYAHDIAAWTFVPGMSEIPKFSSAMMSAFFTWLGFYLPGQLGATVWEKNSWKLFGINTSYHFVCLAVAALILTYMS